MLLLTLACAQRTWTPEVKAKGKPQSVAVQPLLLLDASVEDAGFDEIAIRVQVDERAQARVTQAYRHANVGRYDTRSAVEAGNIWMATGAVLGGSAFLVGGYINGQEDASGDPVFEGGPALIGFTVVGLPIFVAGSFQYATPLFPARRTDRRVESRTTVVDGVTNPWVGDVQVTTTAGETLKAGTTDADGAVRIVLPVPDVDRVQVRLDGPAGRVDLDLTDTEAWLDVRSAQVRELAATGELADLDEAHTVAGRGGTGSTGMWSSYCEGFAEGWGQAHLERRSQHFQALGDSPACQAIWEELDEAWARKLAPAAERGEADWDADLPKRLAGSPEKTPALRGLETCVQLQLTDDPFTVVARATEELADPEFHTAGCFRAVLVDAEREVARIEAEEAAAQRKCDQAKRAVAKEMPRLTSTAYADTAAYGIRSTRDALVIKMNRMVANGGPTYEEDDWVQCVVGSLSAADDMIRGIYQMNYGGYAHEWVELGRFEWAQEGILSSTAQPGEDCRSFVRSGLGSSTLAPIDRYLAAVDRLEETCED